MAGVTQYMLEDKDGERWEDLAALRTPPDKDILSSFLRKHWFLPVVCRLSSQSQSLDQRHLVNTIKKPNETER